MAEKKHGYVRGLVAGAMNHAAYQGWMVGQMDAAVGALEAVRNDARENLRRVPSDKASGEAVNVLTSAIDAIQDLAAKLETRASGEG